MPYAALIISVALAMAPVALADSHEGPGSDVHPGGSIMFGQVNGPGNPDEMMGPKFGNGMMGSSTMNIHMEMELHDGSTSVEWGHRVPTTTPDGRPLPGWHNMGSTTNPGLGWGDRRGENYAGTSTPDMHGHRMSSSTEDHMGSSTDRGDDSHHAPPGIARLFQSFFNFILGQGSSTDNGNASSTGSGTTTTATTTATTTPAGTPPGLIRVFEKFFSSFFGH